MGVCLRSGKAPSPTLCQLVASAVSDTRLPILHLTKRLVSPPMDARGEPLAGVTLVTGAGPAEIACWLEIQRLAFADQPTKFRPPTEADLRRELLDREGWRPNWLRFAVVPESTVADAHHLRLAGGYAVGTVALAIWAGRETRRAVIHRLAVVPQARRRGIGRLLLAAAELAAWEAGHRHLWLETHARWEAAVALYRSQGWEAAQAQRG